MNVIYIFITSSSSMDGEENVKTDWSIASEAGGRGEGVGRRVARSGLIIRSIVDSPLYLQRRSRLITNQLPPKPFLQTNAKKKRTIKKKEQKKERKQIPSIIRVLPPHPTRRRRTSTPRALSQLANFRSLPT